jgi:D-glycero-D-manno-heptose 1,7-bisphosphate phosphatase
VEPVEHPRLVILDRDGVINVDSDDFIKSPREWHALPGSLEAIRELCDAGFDVVVATNQSGVGRGLFDSENLAAIHRRMRDAVQAAGGQLAGIYYCPHHPNDGCECRKPAPGLLWQIARDFARSLEHIPVIGDSARDLEAAVAVGARPILVRTGKGRNTEAGLSIDAEIFDDLAAAAAKLIDEHRVSLSKRNRDRGE